MRMKEIVTKSLYKQPYISNKAMLSNICAETYYIIWVNKRWKRGIEDQLSKAYSTLVQEKQNKSCRNTVLSNYYFDIEHEQKKTEHT